MYEVREYKVRCIVFQFFICKIHCIFMYGVVFYIQFTVFLFTYEVFLLAKFTENAFHSIKAEFIRTTKLTKGCK